MSKIEANIFSIIIIIKLNDKINADTTFYMNFMKKKMKFKGINFIQKNNLMKAKDANNDESINKMLYTDSDEITKLREQIKRQSYLISQQDLKINDLNFKVKKLEEQNKKLIYTLNDQKKLVIEMSNSLTEYNDLMNENQSIQRGFITQKDKLEHEVLNKTGNSDFGRALQNLQNSKNDMKKRKENFRQIQVKVGKMNKEIDSILAENSIPPNNNSKYNDIFQELIDLYEIDENERLFSRKMLQFSFLINRLSASCLQLLRIYFPFPSRQTIAKHINPSLNEYIAYLKKGEINKIHHPTILHSLSSPIKFHVVLAIDAVCVATTNKYLPKATGNLYSFTLYLQPVSFGNSCLPVRLIEHPKGIGNKDIVKMLFETSKQLGNTNFLVKFLSFDGDRCYNRIHMNFFIKYEHLLKNHNLYEIIQKLKNSTNIPNGDYMHITKNQRSHFLKNSISLDKSAKITFSSKDLEISLGENLVYLKDKSLLGSMRDEFALQLFNMENIQKLLLNNNFILVMALLPLSLIHMAMRSPSIPIRDRVYSLSLSFWLIYFHSLTVETRNKKIISERKSAKKYCSFFSVISLKKLLNTILSILIAIHLKYDSVCLDRLGTHCLEFFFGLVRGFSNNVYGWDRFYRTVCKTVFAQDFLNELGILPTIKHRANLAGVVIDTNIEDEDFKKATQEAYVTAENLFTILKSSKKEAHSNSEFKKFDKWLNDMSIHFPDPEKCINPISGIKIIARLINTDKNKKLDEDEEEDEEEEEIMDDI